LINKNAIGTKTSTAMAAPGSGRQDAQQAIGQSSKIGAIQTIPRRMPNKSS